jgi:hypothetical protein
MHKARTLVRLVAVIAAVTAGTSVTGLAASLNLSAKKLGAEQVALPTCSATSVTVTDTHSGGDVKTITLTLTTACTGAVANDVVYAMLEETTAHVGYGNCTLAGATPACTVTLTGTVPYSATDSYTLDIFVTPSVAGAASKSANDLSIAPEYLLLTSCSTAAKGPPTSC